MTNKIYGLLSSLGITANYAGFFYVADAVSMAFSDTGNLLLVTKRLYPQIAKRYNTSAKNVERNIRTIINVAWENNPQLLVDLAQNPLPCKPTPSEVIAILTISLLHSESA